MNEKLVLKLIKNDAWRMEVLEAVRSLNLPDWLVGAGFVRNPVWDYLHGYNKPTPISDIDVAYFNAQDLNKETDQKYEAALKQKMETDWSVTNQARKGNYKSTVDAINHWPETATAIGVWLDNNDELKLVAPHGLEDLFSLTLRMTPDFESGRERFLARVGKKKWSTKWPKLKIV